MVDPIPTAGTENLLGMINGIDVDKVGSVLKEVEKYEKILDKVSGMIMRLNRIGVLPAAIRIIAPKGVDIDKPLPTTNELTLIAKSPVHLLMYKELNEQPEGAITEMFKQSIILNEKAKKGVKKPEK